jgi:hypothetical protein
LDKTKRPGKKFLFWQHLFFHDLFREYSYLWFFLDDRLAEFWPFGSSISYDDYLVGKYSGETEGWRDFEQLFLEWAEVAKALTPRVLVFLYPRNPRSFALLGIHDQMTNLMADAGVESMDLIASIPELRDESYDLYAGPFDGHPGADMHGRVAEVLDERIVELWPEMAGD